MRMFVLPAAFVLGAALYMLVPGAKTWLNRRLCAIPAIITQNIVKRHQDPDKTSVLFVYAAGLFIFSLLGSIVHPICAVLVMAPLFTGFSLLPAAVQVKQELDSGVFAKDIAGYERRVLAACAPMGEAFADHVCAPLLLCALGCALHVGSTFAWVYAGLYAVREDIPAAQKVVRKIGRAADAALSVFLLLCAGLVGRNLLCVGGKTAGERLMHLLGLAGENDHAPIAGDIMQAIFLCCLSAGLLCAVLTAACLPFL